MKIISIEDDFNTIEKGIDRVLGKSKILPERVFSETMKYFLFVPFDDLFMALFYNHIKKFLIKTGEKRFWLVVTDPSPRSYFARYFDFFGAIEFSISDNEGDYISALNDFPSDSPADALIHNSNSVVVSSCRGEWAVFGDRDADIAVCGFSSREKMVLFREVYGSDLLSGVEEAAKFAYGEGLNAKELCNSYISD